MLDAIPVDARAVAALALLAAVPGLLVVRSPWRAMPILSLASWTLAWTWLASNPRPRLLHGLLAVFVALVALRLLRPGPLPRLRALHLVLVGTALAVIVVQTRAPVAAGARMPVESAAAELLVWHEGWPASFEPFAPGRPFRASAVAWLAADVALLSGAPAYRAARIVALAGVAALLLASWWLAACRVGSARGALIAALAAPPLLDPAAPAPPALAAAFAIQAVTLVIDRVGMPSAIAAAACAAAALASDAATAIAVLALLVPAVAARSRAGAGWNSNRLRVAAVGALGLAVPLTWRAEPLWPPAVAPLLCTAILLVLVAFAAGGQQRSWMAAVKTGVVCAGAAYGLAAVRAAEPVPTRDDVTAMEWIRAHTRPLDAVCAPETASARWIPAIAGRARETSRPGSAPARCAVWLSIGAEEAPGKPAEVSLAMRAGTSSVWMAAGSHER